jgi:signal transduction histidine kinase/ligand-binding sensor domain-containing protein
MMFVRRPSPASARLLIGLVLLCCRQAQAAVAAPGIPDLHHTSWTARDGAPPYVIAMAQTPDGWLWLAASNGLFRFDGVRFERFHPGGEQLLSNNLWGMRLLSSGELWLGYRTGGISVIRDGQLRNYAPEGELPHSSVTDFARDASGRLWASTARGLYLFDGQAWRKPGASLQAPATYCTLLGDDQRRLWAQCDDGAFVLAAGAARFARAAAPEGIGRLTQAPDGTVWSVGGPHTRVTALAGPGATLPAPSWPAPRAGGGTVLFERDGRHVWVSRDDGVARTDAGGAVSAFGTAQGLSGASVNAMLQDREGNIWISTENGLDRFRSQALSGVPLPQVYGDSVPIAAGEGGALWVGRTLLARPDRAAFAGLPKEKEDDSDTATALWREGPDSVWIAARDGLWHQQGGTRERVPLPDGMPPDMQINCMVRNRAGDVWLSIRRRGIYRLHAGVWTHDPRFGDVRATAMYADRRGRIWFALAANRLAVLDGDTLSMLGAADGLQVGQALQIVELDNGLWVGGENGLFYFDGARFRRVPDAGQGAGEDGLYGISGMFDDRGQLWLNGAGGITAIAMGELDRAVHDAAYRVRFRRFDHKDGLRGIATVLNPLPSAVAGSDGTLWFATTAGVFWMKPDQAPRNTLAPVVRMRDLSSAGVVYPAGADKQVLRLPPHPARVQIDYTALSLSMPERMQFLYRLDGVDTAWQDGGTARSTTYTDLSPGSYRFRVRAANNDGVWSENDASLRFAVAPTLLQTLWFRLLCGTALVLALWGLYRLRLARVAGQVRRELEARLEERVDERERIARELHDTFLQTVYGLSLKLHAVFQRLPADEPSKAELERSLELAEQALAEGRDRVQGLRQPSTAQQDLLAAVTALTAGAFAGATRLQTRETGARRPLYAPVCEELYAIACEALINAARHAGANVARLEIDYGTELLTMTIADDGCGIAADIQAAGQRSGHFGLTGMRERAGRIGATLTLASSAQVGTCWRLALAGRLAYAEK